MYNFYIFCRCLLVTPALLVFWYPAERWMWAESLCSHLIEWADPYMRVDLEKDWC